MKQRLLFVSISVFLISLLIFGYSTRTRFDDYLQNSLGLLSDISQGRPSAIYFVSNVNTCCRRLPKVRELITQDVKLFIFIDEDFSDADSNNLREAFGLPGDSLVQRIGPVIERIRTRCIRKIGRSGYNFFFFFSAGGKFIEWRAF